MNNALSPGQSGGGTRNTGCVQLPSAVPMELLITVKRIVHLIQVVKHIMIAEHSRLIQVLSMHFLMTHTRMCTYAYVRMRKVAHLMLGACMWCWLLCASVATIETRERLGL